MSKLSPAHEIIVPRISEQVVHQRTRDAYIDANALFKAAPGERRVRDYQKRKKTKRFLKALSKKTGTPIYPKARNRAFGLIQSVRGGNNPFLRGIWFHPRVAIHAAQWLSVEFEVWVTEIIDDWHEMQKLLRPTPTDWRKQVRDELWQKIYRLKGWPWPGMSKNRYSVCGTIFTDLIYDRIAAPGLTQTIELTIPRDTNGEHAVKMHQMLIAAVGIAALQQHIGILLVLMDKQTTWGGFMFAVDQVLPKVRRHLPLAKRSPPE